MVSARLKLRNILSKSRERGTAMLEFGLVCPILLALMMGVVDIGSALNRYMVLAQVAGEGVRSAGGQAGLEPGSFDDLSSPGLRPIQYNVQSKVSSLLRMQNLKMNSVTINSTFDSIPNAVTGLGERTVSVRISGTYNGILPIFRGITITANKSGAYLF